MSRAIRSVALGAVAIAAVGGAVLRWGASDSADRIDVPTYRAVTETFRREVPADGNLEAVQATPILAPRDARMPLKIAWLVEDGARVVKGDVVVRFDPDEMKERLRDGHRSVEQAKKRIIKERTTAASARRKRERESALAEREMQAAEEFEFDDRGILSRHDVIESHIDSELAEARMDHAKKAKQVERSVSSGKLDVLRVQERQAEMVVTRANDALQNTEVVAPNSGLVLLHRDWRGRRRTVGDTVWPGRKIAEVPEDEAMQARVYVLEADGGNLEAGMKATLVLESRPGREYAAKIERVETLAQPRIAEVPVQYFAVVLALEETDREHMKLGQRVRAMILLGEVEAIAVPRQAVFAEGKRSYVHRRNGTGGFDRVEVELGDGTAGRVIIASGLQVGDEIALREPPKGSADAGG
jgi:multidrug efflux pump subunit AcrA (membrane-fusion protein)